MERGRLQVLQNLQKSEAGAEAEFDKCQSLDEASTLFDEHINRRASIEAIQGALEGKRRSAKQLLVLIRSRENPELDLVLSIFAPNQDQTTWDICALAPYFEAIKKEFEIE